MCGKEKGETSKHTYIHIINTHVCVGGGVSHQVGTFALARIALDAPVCAEKERKRERGGRG